MNICADCKKQETGISLCAVCLSKFETKAFGNGLEQGKAEKRKELIRYLSKRYDDAKELSEKDVLYSVLHYLDWKEAKKQRRNGKTGGEEGMTKEEEKIKKISLVFEEVFRKEFPDSNIDFSLTEKEKEQLKEAFKKDEET